MDKRGITLSIMVITVIVMSIIIGATVISGMGSVNNANFDRYISTLESVQEVAEVYKLNNNEYPIVRQNGQIVEVNVNTLDNKIKELLNKYNDIYSNLQVIDTSKINISNLSFGRAYETDKEKYLLSNDIFLINPDSGRIYYMKGYNYNGTRYYCADQKK